MSKKQQNSKSSNQSKNPIGRPNKYKPEFHPQDFINRSKNGESVTEICMAWDIDRQTLYNWSNKHQEFFDAIKKGKDYLDAWFCRFFKKMAVGQIANANITAAIFLAKNAVKWTDRIEQATTVDLITKVDFVDE